MTAKATMSTRMLILGSGPAGLSAAIYGARAGLSPLVIQGLQPGGQLTVTTDVENYPGFRNVIQGQWLMEEMRAQAEHVGARTVSDIIVEVDLSERPFRLKGDSGALYVCDALVIATGAQAKWLGVPGEAELSGKGVSACATCDGFFYRGKRVAVIGGGNTAVEEALFLTNHSDHVTLIHRSSALRAEKILQDRLFAHHGIHPVWNKIVAGFVGDQQRGLTAIDLRDTLTGEVTSLEVDGGFVAIGHHPATELFMGSRLQLDADNYIEVRPGSSLTTVAGVFACGDVMDKVYRQAITAAGTGCIAALDAERFLKAIETDEAVANSSARAAAPFLTEPRAVG